MRKISLISITTIFLTLVIIISCQKEESKLALVTDIAIKTLPERINYYDGDVLDFKGIVVTLTLDNGDTEDVSLSSFLEKGITCFPEDGTELSKEIEDIIITHTASGQNTSYTINVNLIVSISIKTEPNKIDYYIGEYLDLSGLIILFNLDNGETVEIPFLNFENNELVCQPDNGTEITSDIKEIKITQ
jgi:hypothetical protein